MQSRKNPQSYIISLKLGEKFNESFLIFCEKEGVNSAYFTAIGAVEQVELGFYDLKNKSYSFKLFENPMELVSMTGNVAMVDGKPFIHAHGVFSDENFTTVGGHIKDAVAGPTIEIFLVKLDIEMTRKMDEEVGLKLLDLI